MLRRLAIAVALFAAPPALADDAPPLTLAAARASTGGQWRGELQYRDYQSDKWVGIPVSVTIEMLRDRVTLLGRAVYDDGPKRGAVYITSLEMLGKDGASGYSTSFRAGNEPEIGRFTLAMIEARDATHWTMRAMSDGMDDNRPARLRETTVRDGVTLTTLKEVDFTDDAKDAWLQRNRTVLTRSDG
jgi:hypothetical protein